MVGLRHSASGGRKAAGGNWQTANLPQARELMIPGRYLFPPAS